MADESEAISFDDVCTGASSDIQQATKTARSMVTKYGFSEKLGPILYGSGQEEVFVGKEYGHTQSYSEAVAAEIDSEIKRIINEAYDACEKLLNEHKDKLTEVAEYLIANEKIDSEDFDKLMKGTLETKSESATEEPAEENNAE